MNKLLIPNKGKNGSYTINYPFNLNRIYRAVHDNEITLSRGAELAGMPLGRFRRLYIEWVRDS